MQADQQLHCPHKAPSCGAMRILFSEYGIHCVSFSRNLMNIKFTSCTTFVANSYMQKRRKRGGEGAARRGGGGGGGQPPQII